MFAEIWQVATVLLGFSTISSRTDLVLQRRCFCRNLRCAFVLHWHWLPYRRWWYAISSFGCHCHRWIWPCYLALKTKLSKRKTWTLFCSQPIRHNGSFKKAIYLWTLPNFSLPWPQFPEILQLSLWGVLGHDNWWQWNDLHGGLVQDTSAAKMRTEQFQNIRLWVLTVKTPNFKVAVFFC